MALLQVPKVSCPRRRGVDQGAAPHAHAFRLSRDIRCLLSSPLTKLAKLRDLRRATSPPGNQGKTRPKDRSVQPFRSYSYRVPLLLRWATAPLASSPHAPAICERGIVEFRAIPKRGLIRHCLPRIPTGPPVETSRAGTAIAENSRTSDANT